MKKFLLLAIVIFMGLTQSSALAKDAVTFSKVKSKVAEVEKNGAQWTEQQWADAFKEILSECKPFMEMILEMSARIESNPDEALALAAELSEYEKEIKDLEECINKLDKAANESPAGKAIISNDEMMNKILIDAGFSKELIEMFASKNFNKDKDINWDELEASLNNNSDDEPIVGSEVKQLMPLLEQARTQGKDWSEQQWEDTFFNVFTKLQPMMALFAQMQSIDEKSDNLVQALEILTQVSEKYGSADTLIDGLEEAARATTNGAKLINDEERMLRIMERAGWDKNF